MGRKKSPEERAAELEQKKAKLEEQLKQERQRAKKAERERDTRRKVLVGAKVLEHARTDPRAARYLRKIYDELGERERKAFEGFEFPEPEPSQQSPTPGELVRTGRPARGRSRRSSDPDDSGVQF